jgi:hypothetical protein
MFSLWNWLYRAYLWVWDWIRTAVHDPDFQKYQIIYLQLFAIYVDLDRDRIEIALE